MEKLILMQLAGKRMRRKIAEHKDFFAFFNLNAIIFIAISAFFPYIGAYYLSQGLSLADIGILSAIGPVISLFMQPVWGYISDKTGWYMAFFRITVIGCMLTVLIFYRAAAFTGYALAIALFSVFNCGLLPLNDTITVKQVVKRGYQFSMIRLGGTVGFSVMVIFAGNILRETPAKSFGITSAVYLLILAMTFLLPKIDAPDKEKRGKLEVKKLFQNRKIYFVIAYVFVLQCAMGFYSSFLGVYTSSLGYDYSAIGILMCVGAASEIPILFAIEGALRRFKTEAMMIFAGFVLVIRLLLPLTSTLSGMIAAQCLGGLTFMVVYYSAVIFMNNNLAPELCGTGMAVLYVVQNGIASLISNVLGGRFGQNFGLDKTYLLFAAIVLVFNVACMLWLLLRKRMKPASRT